MLHEQKQAHSLRENQSEDGDATQAGRTGSALAADRNLAEVRRLDSTRTPNDSFSSMCQLLRAPSNQLVAPSPLNQSQSEDTVNFSRKTEYRGIYASDSVSSLGQISENASTSTVSAVTAEAVPNTRYRNPSKKMVRHVTAPVVLSLETPRYLNDLGQDYSRYPKSYPPSIKPHRRTSSLPLLDATTPNPFSDSQADIEHFGYPDDRLGALDPYCGGEKGFVLYIDELEPDDELHLPAENDDATFKTNWKDMFARQSIVSTIGAVSLVLGLLCLFVVLPVVTFTSINKPSNAHRNGTNSTSDYNYIPLWARVNNRTYPLLSNVRTGLIDPDTPQSAMTRGSTFDGTNLELVFSDEFNTPNRTFYPGDDPFWTAPNFWYGATGDYEWYDPDAVTTNGGTLQFRFDAFPNHNLQYRSGMLNSWNQLCFKGGVFEVSISLAGPAGTPGLWPGVWTMGNLGRPGYTATTDGVWPYTYDSCDAGITPNQSSLDGLSYLPGQRLNSCTCPEAEHPTPGTGRGAPEIDILEAGANPQNNLGLVTQSYQVAPFDIYYRPNYAFTQIPNYNTTSPNSYCGGPFQQAISATTLLNNAWYDGNAYQKYAFEYIPGTSTGKIAWFVGNDQTFMLDGRAIGPNGAIKSRIISEEPMSMVLNLGMSPSWSEILMGDLRFPTVMHVDYVRIYQRPGQTSITCDPEGYETTEYIKNHPVAYSNPNLTSWKQTNYTWPKNILTGC